MVLSKYDLTLLSDEKNLPFDAVVIGKVCTNEIIFIVSTKAIGKSFRHTYCYGVQINIMFVIK